MGGLHRLRSKRSGEPGSEKNLLREEAAQRRGNCFRWKVAAMKPKAQPCPRPDSRQAKDAGAARSCKETWPTSASAHDGGPGSLHHTGKANHPNRKSTSLNTNH